MTLIAINKARMDVRREMEKDTHPVPVNLLEPEPDHVEGRGQEQVRVCE